MSKLSWDSFMVTRELRRGFCTLPRPWVGPWDGSCRMTWRPFGGETCTVALGVSPLAAASAALARARVCVECSEGGCGESLLALFQVTQGQVNITSVAISRLHGPGALYC